MVYTPTKREFIASVIIEKTSYGYINVKVKAYGKEQARRMIENHLLELSTRKMENICPEYNYDTDTCRMAEVESEIVECAGSEEFDYTVTDEPEMVSLEEIWDEIPLREREVLEKQVKLDI